MGNYDDIIHLPHHQSKTHPHMSLHDRAAQFAPFAALSGYDDMIEEAGRQTSRERDLSEDDRDILDHRLSLIASSLESGLMPWTSLTVFVPDEYKEGGSYQTVTGRVERIDPIRRTILILSETGIPAERTIPIRRIIDIKTDPRDIPDDYSLI